MTDFCSLKTWTYLPIVLPKKVVKDVLECNWLWSMKLTKKVQRKRREWCYKVADKFPFYTCLLTLIKWLLIYLNVLKSNCKICFMSIVFQMRQSQISVSFNFVLKKLLPIYVISWCTSWHSCQIQTIKCFFDKTNS